MLLATCSLLLSVSCAQLQPVPVDPATGRFPQSENIAPSEMLTRKPWPGAGKVGFTYTRIGTSDPSPLGDLHPKYRPFCEDALRRIGFPRLKGDDYMAQLIISHNIDDKIDLTKLDYLNQARLAQAVGPFAIVDMALERAGSGLRFTVRVIDPSKPEKVFEATHEKRMIMSSYDREVIYPVINELKRWFDESSSEAVSPVSAPVTGAPATVPPTQ